MSEAAHKAWRAVRGCVWFQTFMGLLVMGLCAGAAKVWAGDFYVSTWGNDLTGEGSQASPWCTVQHAIDSITGSPEEPHTVHIAGGVYVGNISMDAWENLYGGYDSVTWKRDVEAHPTVLRASAATSAGAVVKVARGSILSGCTVIEGYHGIYCKHATAVLDRNIVAHNVYGIVCRLESSPLIVGNQIIWNTLEGIVCEEHSSPYIVGNRVAQNGGDGIVLRGSRATVSDNTIEDNAGIGMYITISTPVIEHNAIVGNGEDGVTLFLSGGSIEGNQFVGNQRSGLMLSYSQPAISSNQFVRNGTWGLGVIFSFPPVLDNNVMLRNNIGLYSSQHSTVTLLHNTIACNAVFGVATSYFSYATIRNCIIWGNKDDLIQCEASYSCISDGDEGEGNISADPRFMDLEADDLHLAWDSPCIDAGTSVGVPLVDYEGDPRPWGMGFDMGADESFRHLAYDLTQGEQGWTYHAPGGLFAQPLGHAGGDGLVILADPMMPSFGFWQSPAEIVPAFYDSLYRVRWYLAQFAEDGAKTPGVRLRVCAQSLQCSNDLVIQGASSASGGNAAGEHSAAYDLYLVPPVGANSVGAHSETWFLAFDLLSIDPPGMSGSGAVLKAVEVERVGLDLLGEPTRVKTYTFEQSSEGWRYLVGIGSFAAPLAGRERGALFLASLTNTNTFGFWANNPADIMLTSLGAKLYRATFTLRSDQRDPALVPQVRLRTSTGVGGEWVVQTITSVGDGAHSPGRSPLTYALYHPGRGEDGPTGLHLAFDLLNFDPHDAAGGTVYLDEVLVEEMNLPAIE